MTTLRDLIINISANSQSFQSEISRATRLGSDYNRTMQSGGLQAAAAQRESQRALAGVSAQLGETRAMALRLSGAVAGAFATSNLISIADGYNSLSARIKLATTDSTDFTNAQRGLMDISQRTGSALADNAALFSRTSSSLREWGYGTQDILKLTDALANGLQVSGASAEETSSLIVQLSQALGRGVLRGQDFNSVAQSGQRIMKALAEGMGVAQKDLKAMADEGQLTTDKIVPALISQLGKLKDEFNSMPNSVSAASTRINNAFMEWVGGANQSSGATATISGVMDGLAKNIDTVATVAGGLVAVGLARYLGGIMTSAASATGALISTAKSEVALAVAQDKAAQSSVAASRAEVYRSQQALQGAKSAEAKAMQQERVAAAEAKVTAAQRGLSSALTSGTATEKSRARAALERAQAGLVATKNADAQAVAERRLASAQRRLNSDLTGRASTQNNINRLTLVGTRLMSGALGVIGGIPGVVMLGASAWYIHHQNQEQARLSAQEYAKTIEDIRSKTKAMSLTEASDSEGNTRKSLDEQNRLVDDQAEKVRQLKKEMAGYQQMLNNPGITVGGYMVNHLMSIDDATRGLSDTTSALSVEQERLSQMQAKSQSIQDVLSGIEHQRIALLREQGAKQNEIYQSLIVMNGQHTEFNRLLGLGNNLLMARQGLVISPGRVPQSELTSPQQTALEKSRQDKELSKLKGEAKERRRLEFSADKLGLTEEPQYQNARLELIDNGISEWKNTEANKPAKKTPKSAEEKTEDVYKRLIKQQQEQISLSGKNTELAKVKYQVTQGELASLEKAKKETLLQNAALIDQKSIAEQLKTFKDGLADTNAAARDRGNIDFLGAGMGDKARERMKEMENIRSDFSKQQNELQRDFSRGQISEDLYKKQTEALKQALDERLEIQKDYYKKTDEQRSDWSGGVTDALLNYADQASDLSSMATTATSEILSGATNAISSNLTSVLTGASSFKDGMSGIFSSLGETVIQTMIQMATQALITKAIMASFGGGAGGLFGGLFGGAGSAASGAGAMGMSTSWTAYANAKGGVYDSPSLSSFSNGVYSTPQYFAFAKGAGVFGEAGPEAIMPLTRGADGSLGVRAIGRQSAAVEEAARQVEARPAMAVSIDARSTFTGKPDDATMLAIDKRTAAMARRIVDGLTAEVIKPQNGFGRAIYTNLQSKKPT